MAGPLDLKVLTVHHAPVWADGSGPAPWGVPLGGPSGSALFVGDSSGGLVATGSQCSPYPARCRCQTWNIGEVRPALLRVVPLGWE